MDESSRRIIQTSFSNREDMDTDINQVGKTTFEEIMVEIRLKYLLILKSIYWNHFDSAQMASDTFIALNEAVDIAIDNKDSQIDDWSTILKWIITQDTDVRKYERTVQNVPILGKIFKKAFFSRIAGVYDILVNFIESHK